MDSVPVRKKLDVFGEIKDSLSCGDKGRARGLRCKTEGESVFSPLKPAVRQREPERKRKRMGK